MHFQIEPKLLRACAPAMGNEEIRYYLCGVHVFERNGEVFYEATDGHRLIRVKSHVEQQEDVTGLNIIVPAFFVKNVSSKKFVNEYGLDDLQWVDAVVDAQTLRLEFLNGVVSTKLIDGTFPNADAVIPEKTGGLDAPEIGFNLKYMADFAKSLKELSQPDAAWSFTDASGPCVLKKNTEFGEWLGVLMPTRT
jgi:DNA polymerase III sliding clamp (beta) subunit (PCNA family)